MSLSSAGVANAVFVLVRHLLILFLFATLLMSLFLDDAKPSSFMEGHDAIS